ncbi:MAG TPA: DUF1501 domain-containing protein [Gemmataceae bacterium]|nr:DUF1501 domain-containing protein [Gemmataceae bacterium]
MWGITDRRHFIKHAAAFGAFALTADTFLSALRAQAPALKKKNKSLIVIHFGGGYPAIDFWEDKDPHPNMGETKSASTAVSGIKINRLLPKIGAQMKNASLIRTMKSTEGDHARGTRVMMTGLPINPLVEQPHIGSKVAWYYRENEGDLPAFITVAGGGGIGPGFLGQKYGPLPIAQPGQPPENATPARELGMDGKWRMERRADIFSRLEGGFQKSTGSERDQAKSHQDVYDKALSLIISKNKEVFALDKDVDGKSPIKMKAEYGTGAFGQGCLLARKLTEAGAACVEVNTGGWDMHNGIFPQLERRLPEIDSGIGTLLKDLSERGRLQDTVVVTLSEFGRTIRVNNNAGRDHNPGLWSVLIAGGNIIGGQVYGKTSEGADSIVENPVSTGDLFATIYAALGFEKDAQIRDNLGRPSPLAGEKAKPISALLKA